MKEFTIEITRIHTVIEKATVVVTAETGTDAQAISYRRAAEEGAAWREEAKDLAMQTAEVLNWRDLKNPIPERLIDEIRGRIYVNHDRWLEPAIEYYLRQSLCAAEPPKEYRVIDMLTGWRSPATTDRSEAVAIRATRSIEARAADQDPRVHIVCRRKDDPQHVVDHVSNHPMFFDDGRPVPWADPMAATE